MPRVARPTNVSTPQAVLDAIAALSPPGRMELLRLYRREPSTQADAARVLGLPKRTVSGHTAALADLGLLVETQDPDKVRSVYGVDENKLRELLAVLHEYVTRGENGTKAPGA